MNDTTPLILAKAALKDAELNAKMKLNAPGIEIQLLKEFYTTEHITGNILFDRNVEIIKKYPIKAVHAPLANKFEPLLDIPSDWEVINNTCLFAQKVAELKKETIIVILHSGYSKVTLERFNLFNDVVKRTKKLVNSYPNIKLAIENTTNLDTYDFEKFLAMRDSTYYEDNSFHTSNMDLVKACNHERIGCTMDYCHLIMSERLFILMRLFIGQDYETHPLQKQLLLDAAPKTFLYHLSWPQDSGYNNKFQRNHGMGFHEGKDEEEYLLQEFLKLYKLVCKKANKKVGDIPITIEVYENDYSNCTEFASSYKLFTKIFN